MTHGKSLLTSLGTLGPTNTVRLDVPQPGCGPHAVTAKPYVCPRCTLTTPKTVCWENGNSLLTARSRQMSVHVLGISLITLDNIKWQQICDLNKSLTLL